MKTLIGLAGVIGDPIGHSRSPLLHGHWLRRYGLNGHYVPLHIRPEAFETALRTLPQMGFLGVNVTLPHKERALALADSASPLAQRIGAANTLVFRDGLIEADNTDAYGFTANILDHVPGWAPKVAAVIGAGGASRAVIAALTERGAGEIRLTNRSRERAEQVVADFGPLVSVIPWQERDAMLEGCDTLINTTSLGMTGAPPLELALGALPETAVVNDLVYAPLQTDLLRAAQTRGNPAIDGLGMLLHQAVPGFERWFGQRPEVDEALRAAVLAP